MIGRTKETIEYGSLTIKNPQVVSWFCGLEAEPDSQNEWVQDVTGRETAWVSGYSVSFTDGKKPVLEIEYRYEAVEVARP